MPSFSHPNMEHAQKYTLPKSIQISKQFTHSTSSSSSSSPTTPPKLSPNTPPPTPMPHPVAPPPPSPVVLSPCAACKILRRRCVDKCVLAPYFPPTEPHKFTIAHRVFGASNIIKFLQDLPESQRADAVSSMVYEANARLRDPVYGCTGAICHLQKQVSDLQAQLAKAQAELVSMQLQQANVMALFCMEMTHSPETTSSQHQHQLMDTTCFLDDNCLSPSAWETLWT